MSTSSDLQGQFSGALHELHAAAALSPSGMTHVSQLLSELAISDSGASREWQVRYLLDASTGHSPLYHTAALLLENGRADYIANPPGADVGGRGPVFALLARAVYVVQNHPDEFSQDDELRRRLIAVLDSPPAVVSLGNMIGELLTGKPTFAAPSRESEPTEAPKDTPTIWDHGNGTYSIDGCDPIPVSDEEDNILQVFLKDDKRMLTGELQKRSGVTNVSRVVGEIARKYNKRFSRAIEFPKPKKKRPGYYIRVRALSAVAVPA